MARSSSSANFSSTPFAVAVSTPTTTEGDEHEDEPVTAR